MNKSHDNNEVRMQLKEVWDRAREMIKNENELINQRLSWFFASQAFLFAALFVGVNTAIKADTSSDRIIMMIFLFPIIYLGFLISLSAFRMVRDAGRQRSLADMYWVNRSVELLGLKDKLGVKDIEGNNEPEENTKFKEMISQYCLPERVHGKNLETEGFGILSWLPGAVNFTRDNNLPLFISFVWIIMFIFWLGVLTGAILPLK